jgi:hypothetical protein
MAVSGATISYSDCLTASWLAERLAVDPARIEAMRRSGELIAVRAESETAWLYPAWQLSGREPRKVIPRIVAAAAEAGLDDARLQRVLTAPLGLGGRRRLVDLVVEGRDEEVVQAIRGAG